MPQAGSSAFLSCSQVREQDSLFFYGKKVGFRGTCSRAPEQDFKSKTASCSSCSLLFLLFWNGSEVCCSRSTHS